MLPEPDAAPAAPTEPDAPLTLLLNHETSVGENAGTIAPGTISIPGSLTTAQQLRSMGKPTTVTGTVTNGPAPSGCQNVQISNNKTPEESNPGAQNAPGMDPAGALVPGFDPGAGQGPPVENGSGHVSCAAPSDIVVFPGLGATITLVAGEATDVLTLPLTAVKGSVQNGIVWIPAADGAGVPRERPVVLGLNDGEKSGDLLRLSRGGAVCPRYGCSVT